MIDRATAHWVGGARLKPTYIALGDWLPLSSSLQFLSGPRNLLEQAALRLLGRRTWLIESQELKDSVDRIAKATHADAALLLYTGYYKETLLVGPVSAADGTRLFIKYYQRAERAATEVECAKRVQRLASDYFRLARIHRRVDNIVAYELLPRGRRPAPLPAIRQAVGQMAKSALERCKATRSTHEQISEELIERGGQFLPALAGDLRALKAASVETPWPDCHGDFTPWNVFMSADGALCLVDYERAGQGPPLTDLFHFHTQPAALVGKTDLAFKESMSAARDLGFETVEILAWYAIYLALELKTDLQQWFGDGRRHHQLRSLITSKAALLARTLHASE